MTRRRRRISLARFFLVYAMMKMNKGTEGMEKRKMPELLAPAGSVEALYGAICAGADAVYLGGSRFGARAYAENFTTEALTEGIRYAHLFGVKIYMTVNTLLKEPELAEVYEYLLPFYQAGLDGVIIQDFGVFHYLREHFPGLELHASTQMTICSAYGAALLKEMGARRIVPARELSLKELTSIREQVDIELETFIHGAMCYCYSGQCLFSSILGGRSGNRGRCAQPCRLPYTVTDSQNKGKSPIYPLSLKDMCTIEHLPALIEAGIDSFKIEGRMKKPEYTAGVTAIYRKYIDLYASLRASLGKERAAEVYAVEKADKEALSTLYIRSQMQDGYYFRRNGREMVALENPAYGAQKEEQLSAIRSRFLETKKRLPVQIQAVLMTGEPARLSFRSEKGSCQVTGDEVLSAQNKPITEENVRKQLGKLGETAFEAASMQITLSENAFYPLGKLNELRRRAVEALGEELLSSFQRKLPDEKTDKEPAFQGSLKKQAAGRKGFTLLLSTPEQTKVFIQWLKIQAEKPEIKRIYLESSLFFQKGSCGQNYFEDLKREYPVFLALPFVFREADKGYREKLAKLLKELPFDGVLLRAGEELAFIRETAPDLKKCGDAGVYVWNQAAAEELTGLGIEESLCLPYELKAGEQYRLAESLNTPMEKVVYGRIPMMVTANCVRKTITGCRKGDTSFSFLKDRYQKNFPVVCDCTQCMNIIYNSLPLSLWQEREKWLSRVDLRLNFTIEAPSETTAVLNAFFLGKNMPSGEYTTGHEKRGVE